MKNHPTWKLLTIGVWGVLWLLLAISFVLPGLGDNPAYDHWRYAAGGVFVVLTLFAFVGHAWWTNPEALPIPFLKRFARPAGKPSNTSAGARPASAKPGIPVVPAGSPATPDAPRRKTGADLPTVLRDRPKTGAAPAPLKKPVATEAPATPDTPAPAATVTPLTPSVPVSALPEATNEGSMGRAPTLPANDA